MDGLLDTVFDAICELAGEDGRDWVPVRQIQAPDLLAAGETGGRDDTRLEVAFCPSVAAQIEKCSQT